MYENTQSGKTITEFFADKYPELFPDIIAVPGGVENCTNRTNRNNNNTFVEDSSDSSDSSDYCNKIPSANIAIISGDEFLKKDYKSPEWLVEDLIGTGLILFAGIGKVGKTTMMLWLIKSMVEQTNFLGFKVGPRRRIYYFNLEMTMDKLQAYTHIQGHKELTSVDFYDKDNELNFENDEAKFNHLIDMAEQGYKLIIVDTLESFSPNLDHNDSRRVKPIFQAFKDISDRYNCTIIIVDHNNKDNYDPEKNDFVIVRGSSSKTSSVDQTIVLRSSTVAGQLNLATQGRGIENKRIQISQIPEVYGYEYNDGITPLDAEDKKVVDADVIMRIIRELGDTASTSNIASKLNQEAYKVSRICGKLQSKGLISKSNLSQKSNWIVL